MDSDVAVVRTCSISERAWASGLAYASSRPVIGADPVAFADEYAAFIEDRMYELRYPDLPLPTPEDYELAHR